MKYALLPIMLLTFLNNILSANPIALGTPAPELTAINELGEAIDLGTELSTGTALVFFYPKAMTPGCTKQACSLRDAWSELQAREVKIFGISSDTAKTQAEFKDRYRLPFTLIADTDGKVSRAFGKGRWSRHAYIFKDGQLAWSDLSAATSKQAEEVIAALDALEK
jgi:peroxiredoxin Q/BCP